MRLVPTTTIIIMKKILFLLSCLIALTLPSFAQTVTLTNISSLFPPLTNPPPPTASSTPTLQGGVNMIVQAFESGTSNSYWVVYGLKANGLKSKYGGGIGWFEPLSTYVVTGARVDYVDGNFWMPSGSATLQVPINLTSGITLMPFTYAGVGIPITGAKITTSVGTLTVPGTVRDNNGQATAILGYGVSLNVYLGSDWSIKAVADVEKWTGFSGSQYRAGFAYNSSKAGLFGMGLNLGVIKL